jgi:hypothetical protein
MEVNMDFLTTKEMSEIWKISTRRISLLCSQGRVEGVVKKGKTWLIPKGAKKPEDPRHIRENNKKIKEIEKVDK